MVYLSNVDLYLAIIYVSIGVLKFWVMETTNIYDFFHLLGLSKIRPNMNFGGDLAFAHICHNTFFFPSQREWRNAHKQRPK
jgi:hypothetical protein